jgi:hypothetical protein
MIYKICYTFIRENKYEELSIGTKSNKDRSRVERSTDRN